MTCLTVAGGLFGSDGGFGSVLQGLSISTDLLSAEPDERVGLDRLLERNAGDAELLESILERLTQIDLILKTVAEQMLKREYLAHTKSALEDFRAGNAEVFEKGKGAGSFRINQTLNRIAVEQRRMIAAMAEPLDLAPLTREDSNDRIDVDTWSMAKAYLRGNAAGHVIVAMSQPTIGSLPRSLAERRQVVRQYRCVCATFLYRLHHGKAPTSLEDLVEAGWLDAVPKDPFSGAPLEFSFGP